MEVVANTTVVIILQFTNVPNQPTVHLKLMQLCVNYISIKLGREKGCIMLDQSIT